MAGAFGLGTTGMTNFLVPLRARELGASYDVIGLIVGSSALVPALLSVVLGGVIAKIGSRRAFITGCTICATAGLGFTLVDHYLWLLPVQMLLGTARMTAWIASQTYVTNIGPASERSSRAGKFGFFSNLGPMVSTLVIGIAAELAGFRWAFLVVAAYGVAFAAVGIALMDLGDRAGALPAQQRPRRFREVLTLARNKGVQTALSLTFVRLLLERSWQSFMPVILVSAGVPPATASTVIVAKTLVATVTAPLSGRLARLTSAPAVLIAGLAVGTLGLAISPTLAAIPQGYAPAVMVGIAAGLSLPLLMTIIGDSTAPRERALALSMRASVNGTASTTAPALTGVLVTVVGTTLAFGAMAAIAGLFLVLASVTAHKAAQQPRDAPSK